MKDLTDNSPPKPNLGMGIKQLNLPTNSQAKKVPDMGKPKLGFLDLTKAKDLQQ